MSDYENEYLNKYGNKYANKYSSQYKNKYGTEKTRKGLSQSERELMPFIEMEKEKNKDFNWLSTPLEVISDILSLGQYASAGAVDEIIKGVRSGKNPLEIYGGSWKGLVEGATGQRKTSFRDIIFGGESRGPKGQKIDGLITDSPENEWMNKSLADSGADIPVIGGINFKDVAGFAADVLLDPTTYISFGASKAAKAGAQELAGQAVKAGTSSLRNLDTLAKVAKKSFPPKALKEIMEKTLKEGGEDAVKKLLPKLIDPKKMAKIQNELYKSTIKKALRGQGEEIVSGLARGAKEGLEGTVSKASQSFAGEGFAQKLLQNKTLFGDVMDDATKGARDLLEGVSKATGDDAVKGWQKLLTQDVGVLKAIPDPTLQRVFGEMGSYSADLAKLGSEDFMRSMSKLGQKSWSTPFFELKIPERISAPFVALFSKLNPVKELFENSKAVMKFKDAAWAITNTLPGVGTLRKLFGIKNPYQKYLDWMEKSLNKHQFQYLAGRQLDEVGSLFGDHSKDDMRKAVEVLGDLDLTKVTDASLISEVFTNPSLMQKYGLDEKNVKGVKEAFDKARKYTQKLFEEEQQYVVKGIIPKFGFRENYFPDVRQIMEKRGKAGTALSSVSQGFMKQKSFAQPEIVAQEAAKLKLILGIDDDTARALVTKMNWSTHNMDLQEAMMMRGIAHAQTMATAQTIEQFAEFGVRFNPMTVLDDADPGSVAKNKDIQDLINGLTREGGEALPQLGLRQLKNPPEYLKGMYFDNDVATVLERIAPSPGSDENLRSFKNWWGNVSAYWKGMAVMTPGFHMRNTKSNFYTMYMQHGLKAFNLEDTRRSLVAVTYALQGEAKFGKVLHAFGMNEDNARSALNKMVAGRPLKEWVDEAYKRGTISKNIMGFDAETTVKEFADKGPLLNRFFKAINPLDKDNIAMRFNKGMGEIVENVPKFQSFMLNLQEMAGREMPTKGMVDFADMTVKKWFFDYGALCFDPNTEILTDKGWKTIDTISYTQKALSFNLNSDSLEWQDIEYIYTAGYNGDMYSLNNRAIDACVTPRHKWVKIGGDIGGHHSIKKPKYQFKETHNIVGKTYSLKLSCDNFTGAGIAVFDNDFVELCAWVLAEGTYITKGYGVQFYQSKKHNPKYCERIRGLVSRMSEKGTINIYESKKGFEDIMTVYVGDPIGRKIRDYFPGKNLNVEYLKMLTKEQLILTYNILMAGDGHKKGNHDVFTQKNESFVKAFQALCMMIGKQSTARKENGVFRVSVYRTNQKTAISSININIKKYSGKIWCIHTKNSTVIARRNGRVYISGNTEVEKQILVPIIPFYSWLRKNVALQMSELMDFQTWNRRATFAKLDRMKEDQSIDKSQIPMYLREQGYHATGAGEAEGTVRAESSGMPNKDINLLPLKFRTNEMGLPEPVFEGGELLDTFLASANPIIKTALAVIPGTGYDYFRKRDMAPTAQAPRVMRLFATNPQLMEFVDSTLKGLGYSAGLNPQQGKKGELQIDSKVQYVLENNFLLLKRLDQLYDVATEPGRMEQLEVWLAKASGYTEGYAGLNKRLRNLSTIMGISEKEIDVDQEQANRNREIMKKAEEKRKEYHKSLPGYERRSDEYNKRMIKRMKRLGL